MISVDFGGAKWEIRANETETGLYKLWAGTREIVGNSETQRAQRNTTKKSLFIIFPTCIIIIVPFRIDGRGAKSNKFVVLYKNRAVAFFLSFSFPCTVVRRDRNYYHDDYFPLAFPF